jgi:nucleoside 2-deoxyribosyltransferase
MKSKTTKRVYLAGPINGCTDDEANNWRDIAKTRLGARNCIDPMRRDYRGREEQCVTEIVDGDKNDISSSDVVIANCWQVSWGTAMEIHFAHSLSKPVIAVAPPGARVSPWLRYHAVIVRSLDEALALAG